MRRPYWIPYHAPPHDFPPAENALIHPDGLLAVGGDLTPTRLMVAYRRGIFPWYSEDQPILWWSPSERMVLFPEHLKIARSLRKVIQKHQFQVTFDQNFRDVIIGCAQQPRPQQPGTWITSDMIEAYCQLHHYDFAHSVECWYEGQLVGGLYGVALGKIFVGESMFSRMTDASKVAFVHLVRQLQRWGYELIDCQVYTDHLQSLGAIPISREQYLNLLNYLCAAPGHTGEWRFETVITGEGK
ncbi:MAG: leucyl/phenylalanyl-tRNA--protein transferase [Beggiatoa sp. IS2]|nr:MAG: leucyl/phenylalanyl-tRNA--protein transferase [Beggiatoa sp. IS2]